MHRRDSFFVTIQCCRCLCVRIVYRCFETNLCVTLYGHVVEEPCCICVNRLWNPCVRG